MLAIVLAMFCTPPLDAQGSPPLYEVDPFWPKPLPDLWVTGEVGGTCVDEQDHVFVLNRDNLTSDEQRNSVPAPPVVEYDPEGNIVELKGPPSVA